MMLELELELDRFDELDVEPIRLDEEDDTKEEDDDDDDDDDELLLTLRVVVDEATG